MARRRIRRKNDSYLRDGLIIIGVVIVFALIVAGIFIKTKKPIDEAGKEAKLAGYAKVFKGYDNPRFEIQDSFKEIIKEDRTGINDMAVVSDKDGNKIGYAFISKAKGHSDDTDITLAVGIDNDGVITGVEIVFMNETAGVGAKCTDEAFKSQFTGLSGTIDYQKDIDGISGATYTTKGVVNAINICLDYYNNLKDK